MMSSYSKPPSSDRIQTAIRLAVFILVLSIAAVLCFSDLIPGKVTWISFGLFIAIAGMGLFFLVRWHARATAYRCGKCGHKFTISPLKDFFSPHLMSTKYVRCPQCRQLSWARILMASNGG